MADRHQLAAQADSEQNLKKLAVMLTAAVNECETNGIPPNVDPAVMVLCYQISFAGNGDSPIPGYYQRLHKHCVDNIDTPIGQEKAIEYPKGSPS